MAADTLAAWVHPEQVAHSWFTSILGVVMSSPRVGPYMAMRCGSDGLPAARNRVAAAFLNCDPVLQWLWWSDTDQGFAPDTLDRLLDAADPQQRPIVAALAFAQVEFALDGMGGFRTEPRPALFRWTTVEDRSGFTPMLDYPRDTLVEVAGVGSACVVIHRSVIEKIAAADGPTWYTRLTNPTTGQLIGEDLSFCYRAVSHGFPVHCDTSVKTNHLKPIWLSEDHYDHPGG